MWPQEAVTVLLGHPTLLVEGFSRRDHGVSTTNQTLLVMIDRHANPVPTRRVSWPCSLPDPEAAATKQPEATPGVWEYGTKSRTNSATPRLRFRGGN